MNIIEKRMDLFDVPSNYTLVECISSDFAMGAGIAKEFRSRGCADELKRTYNRGFWSGKGYCLYAKIDGFKGSFHLVTKHKYWNKPTYDTLKESLLALKNNLNSSEDINLAMPRIGCGLDRLDWNKVRDIIKEVFSDINNINILVCYI